jgi:hypothetical protein
MLTAASCHCPRNADGSLTLCTGANAPDGEGREADWLLAPQSHFSLYVPLTGANKAS